MKRKPFSAPLAATLLAGGMTATAVADNHIAETMKGKVDGSFISLRGTIVETSEHAFLLDYGEGKVMVEVDDFRPDDEGELFLEGDDVTVFGLVDDEFYQAETIEAASVYVDDLNTTLTNFSPADEEELAYFHYYVGPIEYDLEVMGTVTSTSEREFTIDTGKREVKVDTMLMAYNPMDDQGFQQIDVGDFVRVSGDLDADVFEKREIIAESIVSISI